MYRGTLLIFSLLLSGCSLFQGAPDVEIPKTPKGLQKRVFVAPMDRVWRAVQIVMIAYPPLLNSPEEGIFETDYVKGNRAWVSPHKPKRSTLGHRYKLFVHVTKGQLHDREAIKVSVRKQEEVLVDFFSSPKPVQSDGLEEYAILYRIKRELQIDQTLSKLREEKNRTKSNKKD